MEQHLVRLGWVAVELLEPQVRASKQAPEARSVPRVRVAHLRLEEQREQREAVEPQRPQHHLPKGSSPQEPGPKLDPVTTLLEAATPVVVLASSAAG